MEDTLTGNKLIAEFMGGKHNGGSYYKFYDGLEIQGLSEYERPASWIETNLKYHTSFDWLMPVAQKIGKLSPLRIDYSPFSIRISDAGIVCKHLPTPIENVFAAIVLYIQWYNQPSLNK